MDKLESEIGHIINATIETVSYISTFAAIAAVEESGSKTLTPEQKDAIYNQVQDKCLKKFKKEYELSKAQG